MNAYAVSSLTFIFVFGGALFGMFLSTRLPQHYLEPNTKDVVKLVMGLVVTMSALVLGLLVSSAKATYDAQKSELTESSARIMLLNGLLEQYGPEANEAHTQLREAVIENLNLIWPQERSQASVLKPAAGNAKKLYQTILTLTPKNDVQRTLQGQAAGIAIDLGQTRSLMYAQGADSVSSVLLLILGFWLTMTFFSFGFHAPHNAVVVASLFVAGLSVSGAIFLILEMYRPYTGLIKLSSTPIRMALMQLGQ